MLIALVNLKFQSTLGRLFILKISFNILNSRNIFFGNGIDTFARLYSDSQFEYFRLNKYSINEYNNAGYIEYAYNDFLEIFIEYGLIALLIVLTILMRIFRNTKFLSNINLKLFLVFCMTFNSLFFLD